MKRSILLVLGITIGCTSLGLTLFFGFSFSVEMDRVMQRDLNEVMRQVELRLEFLGSLEQNDFDPSILFESLLQEHTYISEADLFTIGAEQQWSLLHGSSVELSADILSRLSQQRQVRTVSDNTVTVYQRYQIFAGESLPGRAYVLEIAYDTSYHRTVLQRFYLRAALITLILIILCISLAGIFLDRRLITQVSSFKTALMRASEGFYAEQLSLDQPIPEYREIAVAFNTLVRAALNREKKLERQAADLSGSLEQRDVLLREIHHRVKNNLQIITSLISIEQGRVDHASVEVFSQMNTRVRAMSSVHEILYETDNLNGAQLEDLVERVFNSVLAVYGLRSKDCAFSYNVLDISLPIDIAIPLAIILTEAITNSLKYGRNNNHAALRVSAYQLDIDSWCVAIKDSGPGFPEDVSISEGFGIVLMRGLSEQIEGRLNMYNNNGAIIELTLPMYASTANQL